MAQITDHSEKDATLLLGFRQGDAASLRQLLTRYRREIHYFTWSILKDRQTADEIVNDAFLKVWKVRAEFASLAQIRSYLYVVSKNECLNFLKSPRGRRLEHIDSVAHLLHSEESIETHMMHSELLSAVYDEVQKLPKKQRRVFQLAFFEGLSTEEIAAQLGISTNAVFLNKSQALKTIRRVFKGSLLAYTLFYCVSAL